MSILFTLLFAIGSGVVLWFGAESLERRRSHSRIRSLENKLRFTESRAISFRDQFEKLQKDVTVLRASLDHERESKAQAMAGFHQSFRKGVLITGSACLMFGLTFGGMVTGLWVKASTDQTIRTQMMELHVIARVAEMNSKMFKEQFESLKDDFNELRMQLDHERVEKVVALTKLQLLLENLVEDKWKRGFTINTKKLAKLWEGSRGDDALASSNAMVTPPVPSI